MDRRDLLSFADFVLHGDSAGEGGRQGGRVFDHGGGQQARPSRPFNSTAKSSHYHHKPVTRQAPTLELSRAQRVRAKYRFILAPKSAQGAKASSSERDPLQPVGAAAGSGTANAASTLSSTPPWSSVLQVVIDSEDSRRFRCPVCLEPPTSRAAVMAKCGHVYCAGCWLSYVASSDATAANVLHSYNIHDTSPRPAVVGAGGATSWPPPPPSALPPPPCLLRCSVPCPVCAEWCDAADTKPVAFRSNDAAPAQVAALMASAGSTITSSVSISGNETTNDRLSGARGALADIIPRLPNLTSRLAHTSGAEADAAAAISAPNTPRERSVDDANAALSPSQPPLLTLTGHIAHTPAYIESVLAPAPPPPGATEISIRSDGSGTQGELASRGSGRGRGGGRGGRGRGGGKGVDNASFIATDSVFVTAADLASRHLYLPFRLVAVQRRGSAPVPIAADASGSTSATASQQQSKAAAASHPLAWPYVPPQAVLVPDESIPEYQPLVPARDSSSTGQAGGGGGSSGGCLYTRTSQSSPAYARAVLTQHAQQLAAAAAAALAEQQSAADAANAIIAAVLESPSEPSRNTGSQAAPSRSSAAAAAGNSINSSGGSAGGSAWGSRAGVSTLLRGLNTSGAEAVAAARQAAASVPQQPPTLAVPAFPSLAQAHGAAPLATAAPLAAAPAQPPSTLPYYSLAAAASPSIRVGPGSGVPWSWLTSAQTEAVGRYAELATQAGKARAALEWALATCQYALAALPAAAADGTTSSSTGGRRPSVSSSSSSSADGSADAASCSGAGGSCVLLYQSLCGEPVFMHPLCVETILSAARQAQEAAAAVVDADAASATSDNRYGSNWRWSLGPPPTIVARVTQIDVTRVSYETLRKCPYLSPLLPVGTGMQWVEIDLGPSLSPFAAASATGVMGPGAPYVAPAAAASAADITATAESATAGDGQTTSAPSEADVASINNNSSSIDYERNGSSKGGGRRDKGGSSDRGDRKGRGDGASVSSGARRQQQMLWPGPFVVLPAASSPSTSISSGSSTSGLRLLPLTIPASALIGGVLSAGQSAASAAATGPGPGEELARRAKRRAEAIKAVLRAQQQESRHQHRDRHHGVTDGSRQQEKRIGGSARRPHGVSFDSSVSIATTTTMGPAAAAGGGSGSASAVTSPHLAGLSLDASVPAFVPGLSLTASAPASGSGSSVPSSPPLAGQQAAASASSAAARSRAALYRELMGITHLPDDPSFLLGDVLERERADHAAKLGDVSHFPALASVATSPPLAGMTSPPPPAAAVAALDSGGAGTGAAAPTSKTTKPAAASSVGSGAGTVPGAGWSKITGEMGYFPTLASTLPQQPQQQRQHQASSANASGIKAAGSGSAGWSPAKPAPSSVHTALPSSSSGGRRPGAQSHSAPMMMMAASGDSGEPPAAAPAPPSRLDLSSMLLSAMGSGNKGGRKGKGRG